MRFALELKHLTFSMNSILISLAAFAAAAVTAIEVDQIPRIKHKPLPKLWEQAGFPKELQKFFKDKE